jgi:membrane protein DedA with SNARE-associated domain
LTSIPSIEYLLRTYGYPALLIGTFFEGETFLIIGGFIAHLGYLELKLVMLVALIGSFSGDQFFFILGRLRGRQLLVRYKRIRRQVNKVNRLLERYHDLIMLGFRFVYGMRIVTPLILGSNHRIKTSRFIILNLVGAIIWSVVVATGGYLFGEGLEVVLKDIRKYEIEAIIVLSLLGISIWLFHLYRSRGK